MKVICDSRKLKEAVSKAAMAAASRSSLLALEGILIEARDGKLRLTGYDTKKGIITQVDDAVILEGGATLLDAKLLQKIVNALPDFDVTITQSKTGVTVSSGEAKFHLTDMPCDEFPALPDMEGGGFKMEIPEDALADAIQKTIFSVSYNESRPLFTGELFDLDRDALAVVALDGYRVAVRKIQMDVCGDLQQEKVVIPGYALTDIGKICEKTSDMVKIAVSDKFVSFSFTGTKLITRRLNGEFLDYKKAIPSTHRSCVLADRDIMKSAVERVAKIADDAIKNPVVCEIAGDVMRFSIRTATAAAADVIGVTGDGAELKIGLNVRYLLDVLKALPSGTFRLYTDGPQAPCVFLPEEDDGAFAYMILPVRLKD